MEEIFQLLVMQHPDYSNFSVEDDSIAFAQKVKHDVKSFELKSTASFKYKIVSMLKALVGRKF